MGMSDYVRALREKVGHDLLFMPSTHALIRDGAGRILLVQHVEGRWQLPGGAVEPGEGPAEAVRRECLEEAGVTIEPLRIVGVYGGPEYRVTYSNGDEAGWVVTIFEARIVEGEPAPSDDETADVGWFSLDELDALPQSDATRLTLGEALSGRSF
jgi:8-oxo-dGTP pyrophosphatase MutT (NUDIX family)